MPLLLLWAFMACYMVTFTFNLYETQYHGAVASHTSLHECVYKCITDECHTVSSPKLEQSTTRAVR